MSSTCRGWTTCCGSSRRFHAAAPQGSLFVVEADERFDFGLLPAAEAWDVRTVSAGGGGDCSRR